MRITTSDIHRIIEDERRFQAAHRRREEMLRIKGRDLRKLVREVLVREGSFPEQIAGAYGEEPPSPEEMAAAFAEMPEHMDEDELEGPLGLVNAALEGDTDALGEMASEFMSMTPGDMMKFDVSIILPDADPIYVTRSAADTWVVTCGDPSFDPEATKEYDDAEDAAVGVVARCRLGMMEDPEELVPYEETFEDPFDPMEDWMEDERRAMRGEDY